MKLEFVNGPLDGVEIELPVAKEKPQNVSIRTGKPYKEDCWFYAYPTEMHCYRYDEYDDNFVYDASMYHAHRQLEKIFTEGIDDSDWEYCQECREKSNALVIGRCGKCLVKMYKDGRLIDAA